MKSYIDELTPKGIETYMSKKEFGAEVLFQNFFPIKKTRSLKFETLIGSQGNPVAASIVTYNAESPIISRRVVDTLTGSIPPTRIKMVMQESDINEYNEIKSSTVTGANELLEFVFGDVNRVVEGCLARLDLLGLNALSQGYIAYNTTNNNGIVTANNIDFQMPAANKRVVKSSSANRVWADPDPDNPKPITDIRDIQQVAMEAGTMIKYIVADWSTINYVLATTQVIQQVGGASTSIRQPNLSELNAFLTANQLPTFISIFRRVDVEGANGTTTTVNPWNTSYVTFIPEMAVGNTLVGPLAAETNGKNSSATTAKSKNILVRKWGEDDPIMEVTQGLINAFPSWPSIDRCYRLDVTANASDGLDD